MTFLLVAKRNANERKLEEIRVRARRHAIWKGRWSHSCRSTRLHNICIECTCLTEIFRTSRRVRGSSINVSHVEERILRWDSGFPGGDLSYSLQFSAILWDFHRESIPLSWISSLFTSFRIRLTIPARGSTLFFICISFISRLVISSVSFVYHQKDPDADREKN